MYIKGISDLIEMLILQAANLPTYQAAVGATVSDISDVNEDLANLQYIVQYAAAVDAAKQAVIAMKTAMFEGNETNSIGAFPVFPVAAPPSTPLANYRGRAQARNRRFKLGPGYVLEIAVALGIDGNSNRPRNLAAFLPEISVEANSSGNSIVVTVKNRGQADMWDILFAQRDANVWQVLKSATGKSIEAILPNDSPQPAQFRIRVQLKKKNEKYGQASAISLVTVNP